MKDATCFSRYPIFYIILSSLQGINGTFHLEVQGAGDLFDVTPREGINLASFLIRVKNPALIDFEKIQGNYEKWMPIIITLGLFIAFPCDVK